jgi:hypothetical protein
VIQVRLHLKGGQGEDGSLLLVFRLLNLASGDVFFDSGKQSSNTMLLALERQWGTVE